MEKSTGMILAHAGEEYDQYYNAIVPVSYTQLTLPTKLLV